MSVWQLDNLPSRTYICKFTKVTCATSMLDPHYSIARVYYNNNTDNNNNDNNDNNNNNNNYDIIING